MINLTLIVNSHLLFAAHWKASHPKHLAVLSTHMDTWLRLDQWSTTCKIWAHFPQTKPYTTINNHNLCFTIFQWGFIECNLILTSLPLLSRLPHSRDTPVGEPGSQTGNIQGVGWGGGKTWGDPLTHLSLVYNLFPTKTNKILIPRHNLQ